MKRKNSWTPEEDQKLRDLAAARVRYKDMPVHLPNRSVQAMRVRSHKIGIRRYTPVLPKKDPATAAQIIKFKMAGWTHEEIAEVCKSHVANISRLLTAFGFKRKWKVHNKPYTPRWKDYQVHALRQDIKRGYTGEDLYARHLYQSRASVDRKVAEITKYWPSPEERARREAFEAAAEAKQLKVDWSRKRRVSWENRISLPRNKNGMPPSVNGSSARARMQT